MSSFFTHWRQQLFYVCRDLFKQSDIRSELVNLWDGYLQMREQYILFENQQFTNNWKKAEFKYKQKIKHMNKPECVFVYKKKISRIHLYTQMPLEFYETTKISFYS
jgi:hypothetical protein